MGHLRRLTGFLATLVLCACSGSEFASGTGRLADGGPAAGGATNGGAGGASSAGGTTGKGGTAGGGGTTGKGGTAGGAGGASAGGTRATGGTTGNGGGSSGGTAGSGGTGTGGGGAGGTMGAGGGTAGVPNSGDCVLDQGTCGGNSRCVEVTPGGFRVCTTPFVEPTDCNGTGCCKSSECQGGSKCYSGPLAPRCGGIIGIGGNICASDLCTSDAGCAASEICVPAGAVDRKIRSCMPASCRRDTDCKAQAGGICAPVTTGCCSGVAGLFCVYPKGCRKNSDCASGNCQITAGNGGAQCSPDPAICPL